MTSIRHNASETTADDAYLDAAREAILAVGWRRSTLTDVARRAGVSRMTIYRRWPDMQALLGDLMVREWGTLLDTAAGSGPHPPDRRAIARAVGQGVTTLRLDPLFRKIVEVDPELLLPYLVQRRGRTQDQVLSMLTETIRAAQGRARGSVRAGDPATLASALLLTLHGFLLSAPLLTDDAGPPGSAGSLGPDLATLDAQLVDLVERYLGP